MTRSISAIPLAAILIAGAAQAAPDQQAIAEALDNARGGEPMLPAAVDIERCETVPGQPGYDCTFSIDVCFEDGQRIALCDNPGVSERAIFIGGDNGWLALDIQYPAEIAPRVPLDPSATGMQEISRPFLLGQWDWDGSCAHDGAITFESDGHYYIGGLRGRWALEETVLILHGLTTLMDGSPIVPPMPEAARAERWMLADRGRNIVDVTLEDGQTAPLIRC